ncbi:hypothetical protein EDB83DRAFT_2350541 [Lactarius deliciosus]|nr:hypothetical protein EDB83DRAFT_2350541 [Lactarius deliciosus]
MAPAAGLGLPWWATVGLKCPRISFCLTNNASPILLEGMDVIISPSTCYPTPIFAARTAQSCVHIPTYTNSNDNDDVPAAPSPNPSYHMPLRVSGRAAGSQH